MTSRDKNTRSDRATEIIAHEAAAFIAREASHDSLITVTHAESDKHGEVVRIFVSIFPIEKAPAALSFLERKREDFSHHLKTHAKLRLPRVDFLLENGDGLAEVPKT